jgi:hypothetical protein
VAHIRSLAEGSAGLVIALRSGTFHVFLFGKALGQTLKTLNFVLPGFETQAAQLQPNSLSLASAGPRAAECVPENEPTRFGGFCGLFQQGRETLVQRL